MTKEEIKKRESQLIEMTVSFSKQYLDDEYARLCEKMIQKMGRKRNVPFERGKIEIWAAAVIHALGTINFLFDNSFEPYVDLDQINDYFDTKKSTVATKSKQIRDMFRMNYYDSEFSTQEIQGKNPFNDMVMVDGFIVSVSSLPEKLQEIVRTERAAGRDIEFKTK